VASDERRWPAPAGYSCTNKRLQIQMRKGGILWANPTIGLSPHETLHENSRYTLRQSVFHSMHYYDLVFINDANFFIRQFVVISSDLRLNDEWSMITDRSNNTTNYILIPMFCLYWNIKFYFSKTYT